MLSFLLIWLFSFGVADSIAITLPIVHRNQTEFLGLSLNNSSMVETDSYTTTAPNLLGNPIDKDFKTIIKAYPDVKVSGKSTYMNILKAMIELSYSESTHAFAGGTFFFHGYTDVKVRITPPTSSSSALQYRYAIWGLFKAAHYLTEHKTFTCIIMDLYWFGSGEPVLVGVIEIFPDPLPDVSGSKEPQNLMGIGQQAGTPPNAFNLANFTSIGNNETALGAPTNAGKFLVYLELQGPSLSLPEVFMTIFLALMHIASKGTAQLVQNFEVRDLTSKMELVYEHYGPPRESPPFFTYREAARALGYVPKYMFAQHRFEAVTFVLEIDGTPVGTGFLRSFSSTSSVASQKG